MTGLTNDGILNKETSDGAKAEDGRAHGTVKGHVLLKQNTRNGAVMVPSARTREKTARKAGT